LCFNKRFSEQSSFIRLKLNILAPPNFWAGHAAGRELEIWKGRSRELEILEKSELELDILPPTL